MSLNKIDILHTRRALLKSKINDTKNTCCGVSR